MNSITDLLDLEDNDISISNIETYGTTKILTVETKPVVHHCPICDYKMHSRGIKTRTINHPIIQDGYELQIKLKQRRWRCTNPQCRYEANESFKFVNKQKRNTNAAEMLIINAFRNLDESAVSIAAQFNVSDTYALQTFDKYVKLERLPLPDIISVDEVFLDMDQYCKYALVIQDFYTGEPIDILQSRRESYTEPYFVSIPREERSRVKYLISDMYNQYIRYVDKYFPNAVAVVDSFHVTQWIVHKIDLYIRSLIREFKQRDREDYRQRHPNEEPPKSLPPSREVYLLQKYRWLILSNQENLLYHSDPRMDYHFHCLMNTYDYEDELFRINPRLQRLRDLKELFIRFNHRNAGDPSAARLELDELIEVYLNSGDSLFIEFANLLIRYQEYILNSFIMVEKYGNGKIYDSRLSNGPIESLNRKIKDLKRLGRGFRNFEHFRNRFLFATRNNPLINGSVDSKPVIYYE